jgi:arylsulfatase A
VIPAGSVCHELATTMDLLPTFAKLSGADVPGDRVIDGKDIAALLLATPNAKTPHDRFFYQQGGMLRAVRSGPWKLFVSGELYNLDADLAETTNVAGDNPDVVAKLRKLISDFKADLAANSRKVGVAKNARTLVPRPGVDGEEGYRPTLSLPRVK